MEPIRNVFITLEQFEEIQSKYDGVCEYLNGEIPDEVLSIAKGW